MKPSARLLKIFATSTLIEYARIDHLAPIGMLVKAIKNRLSLKPFEIDTQVLSWNEQYFYVRHTFRSVVDPDRPIATAYSTVRFPSCSGTAAPAAIVRLATDEHVIPPLLDDALRAEFGMCPLPTGLSPIATH
jgi:hypothetical protein